MGSIHIIYHHFYTFSFGVGVVGIPAPAAWHYDSVCVRCLENFGNYGAYRFWARSGRSGLLRCVAGFLTCSAGPFKLVLDR